MKRGFEYDLAWSVVKLRWDRGLTQTQVAELVGTTQSVVARLERGLWKPSTRLLERVANCLDGDLVVELRVRPGGVLRADPAAQDRKKARKAGTPQASNMLPQSLRFLFKDVDVRRVDVDRDATTIIERIAEHGREPHVIWAVRTYGKPCVTEVIKGSERISKARVQLWLMLMEYCHRW